MLSRRRSEAGGGGRGTARISSFAGTSDVGDGKMPRWPALTVPAVTVTVVRRRRVTSLTAVGSHRDAHPIMLAKACWHFASAFFQGLVPRRWRADSS